MKKRLSICFGLNQSTYVGIHLRKISKCTIPVPIQWTLLYKFTLNEKGKTVLSTKGGLARVRLLVHSVTFCSVSN
jgi:hypothetical protein